MGMKRKNSIEKEAASPRIEQDHEDEVEDNPPLSIQEMEERDRDYFDKLPPGFRFLPTGEELIVHYLNNKVSRNLSALPLNRIRDVNIYNYHPQELTSMYKLHRGKEWYFFTPRTKKYPNGQRPDRTAGNGFWKASSVGVPVCNDQGIKIGTKRAFVYCERKSNEKNTIATTNWLMQEYTSQVDNITNNVDSVEKKDAKDMKLGSWVLCKIYKNSHKYGKAKKGQQDANNTRIVKANNNNQLLNYQNPNGDTCPRQNVQLEPNPATNENMSTQWLDGGSSYNMDSYPMQNFQVSNSNTNHGLFSDSFPVQNDGSDHVADQANNNNQLPNYQNPNGDTCPRQNVQLEPNPTTNENISTQWLDGGNFYNMDSYPMQNFQVLNSNTNHGLFSDSFPMQNDGSDHIADNLYNMVNSPLSDYNQDQNIYGRNGPCFHLLGYEPSETPSQEALKGEELTEYLDYQAIFNFKDEETFDFKDEELREPDQASLNSKEKKKGG